MPHPISLLGAVHTVVSLIPLIAGVYSFARYSRIDTSTQAGKIYLITTTLAVLTSFGVSSTGGLNAGHAFGIVVLLVAFGGLYAQKLTFFGKLRPYLSTFGLSFSVLLSLVPGTNETLSRLPPSHPIGNGPASLPVQITLLFWLVVFIFGYALQCRLIYARSHGSVYR